MKKFAIILLNTALASVGYAGNVNQACVDNSIFNIGAGIYDITGPVAEQRMMGYAMLDQQAAGLQARLWARAFVIESPCNGKRVVFVNADLGQLFQAVKEDVVKKLKVKYGDRYTDENVLITATHQHSGPGGYSTYTLYNLSILGFSRSNFDAIVNGIIMAIERAQTNLTSGHIRVAKGQLSGVSFNRSPTSYLLNPEHERQRYARDVDTEMTLLRFDTIDGKPIGMLNWFPVHGVSMNNKNHLINTDNKGYAEYLFEKDFQSDHGPHAFVAAFAQANAGDVSPNELGQEGGSGEQGLLQVIKAGKPQYAMAKNLYASATELVTGGVDFRHEFVAFDQVNIAPQYTDGLPHTTCPAAIGISMLAGTADGEGVGKQGVSCENIGQVFPGLACSMVTTACQGVKPIALQLGSMKPYPWVPNILPFQVLQLGDVFIAAAPFELTTMSGRRLKATIDAALPNANQHHVVLSALSNAYVQYITTPEEYQLQRYEGASTLFGPWALAALQQEYTFLTNALLNNTVIQPGPTPPDLLDVQVNLQSGVLFDDKPLNKDFGSVYQDALPTYHPGDTIKTIFWGAHPKNNFRTQDTFLAVQKLEQGTWKTIRTDNDWDTEYQWQRNGIAYSLITIVWHTTNDLPAGYYRIVHYGDWKSIWGGKISPYTGYSSIFRVA